MSYQALHWDEELSTGWVRCAHRTRINGVIHLGPRHHEPPHGEYRESGKLTPRPDRNGAVAIHHGRDMTIDTVTTYRATKLISWRYCTKRDSASHEIVAYAVIAWTDTPAVASLDILDTLPEVPARVVRRAAFHAIHDAADAGALLVTTTLTTPVLKELGFTTDINGARSLDVATMS